LSRKPRYRLVDGFRMPLGFPPDGLESGMQYCPESGDVFVATYPKCGTTWVQYIVYLLERQRPIGPRETLTELFPHLEEVGAESVRTMERPRLVKTHLPLPMTPFSADASYVLVIRNPFDCAVSFFHHTRGFPRHYDFADGDFDTFVDCFIAGEVDFGDYFDHLVPWVEAASRPNVLLVRYEELKRDPAGGIRRIGEFVGGRAADFVGDADALDWVAGESSLDNMRRHQSRWSSPRPEALPFVRSGTVGEWRGLFSPRTARALADKFVSRTSGTAAAGLWPDIIAEARAL
jgi:hypothetical protein